MQVLNIIIIFSLALMVSNRVSSFFTTITVIDRFSIIASTIHGQDGVCDSKPHTSRDGCPSSKHISNLKVSMLTANLASASCTHILFASRFLWEIDRYSSK